MRTAFLRTDSYESAWVGGSGAARKRCWEATARPWSASSASPMNANARVWARCSKSSRGAGVASPPHTRALHLFGESLLHPRLHLVGRQILEVRCERPLVAVRIGHHAVAITPEHVGGRHLNSR